MFIIIYVVKYNINLYQLHTNIKKVGIIVLIHAIGYQKVSIYRFLGKVLTNISYTKRLN